MSALTTTNGQQRVGPGIYITAYTRTVITCARLEGLTRPGEAAAGLPDDFGLLKEDVPVTDTMAWLRPMYPDWDIWAVRITTQRANVWCARLASTEAGNYQRRLTRRVDRGDSQAREACPKCKEKSWYRSFAMAS